MRGSTKSISEPRKPMRNKEHFRGAATTDCRVRLKRIRTTAEYNIKSGVYDWLRSMDRRQLKTYTLPDSACKWPSYLIARPKYQFALPGAWN